jgi:hypothetical protein
VFADERVLVTRIELGFLGFWEVFGALNSLEPILKYLIERSKTGSSDARTTSSPSTSGDAFRNGAPYRDRISRLRAASSAEPRSAASAKEQACSGRRSSGAHRCSDIEPRRSTPLRQNVNGGQRAATHPGRRPSRRSDHTPAPARQSAGPIGACALRFVTLGSPRRHATAAANAPSYGTRAAGQSSVRNPASSQRT